MYLKVFHEDFSFDDVIDMFGKVFLPRLVYHPCRNQIIALSFFPGYHPKRTNN